METDQQTHATSGVRFPPPFYYLIGLMLGFGIQWLLPVQLVTTTYRPLLSIAGAAAILLGLSLGAWAVITFRHAGTSPNPHKPTTAFTTAGPYRFTRNPMYLGLTLVSFGISLLGNALWPLLAVPVVVLLVDRSVITREEHYLEKKFGADYLGYKQRTRRWFG